MAGKGRQQRKAKQARRTNQRAAIREQRRPTAAETIATLLAVERERLLDEDPIGAELVASSILAAWYEEAFEDPDGIDEDEPPALPLVRSIASVLDELAAEPRHLDAVVALVAAVKSLDPAAEELTDAAVELLADLRSRGATGPAWAAADPEWTLAEAWVARDVWDTTYDLVTRWRSAAGSEHALITSIAEGADYQFCAVDLAVDLDEVLEHYRAAFDRDDVRELLVLEQITPTKAGSRLQAGIENTWEEDGAWLVDSGASLELLAIVENRFERLLPLRTTNGDEWSDGGPVTSELDDLARPQLIERFTASDELAGARAAVRDQAPDLVEHAQYRAVYLAQCTPDHAEALLVALMRAAGEDADLDAAAEAVRCWSRFTARHAGLPAAALDATLARVAEVHARATAEGIDALAGQTPSDRFLDRARAAGVDVDDRNAMQAYVVGLSRLAFPVRALLVGTPG